MAESTSSPAARPAPQKDFPLALSFLREDIQEVREDIRHLHQNMQNIRQEMHQKLAAVNSRMDEFRRELYQCIDTLSRRLDSRFTLLLTVRLTLGGIMVTLSDVIVAILKS